MQRQKVFGGEGRADRVHGKGPLHGRCLQVAPGFFRLQGLSVVQQTDARRFHGLRPFSPRDRD